MKNWTIGKRITFGFGLVLAIMLTLGILTYSRLNIVQAETGNITQDTIPCLEILSFAQKANMENRLLVNKHINAESAADMDSLEAKIKENTDSIAEKLADYEKKASPEAKRLLEQVKTSREAYKNVRTQILVLSRAATNAEASRNVFLKARAEMDPVSHAYVDALDKCYAQENKEAHESSDSILSAARNANLGLIIGLTIALSLGIGLAFIIIRSTTRVLTGVSTALHDGANQVVSAAEQVSGSSQILAEGASEQAASIEETSSSLEELSSMTKRNAENSGKANDLSKQTRSAADKGVADMQEMTAAMAAIKESSDDIAKIIKTIDEIAFQTNILALNAAVEAARAGEAGMGFAVVADEVRNLAQRSAQAAKETAAKIEGAIVRTAQGVELSGKVSQTLNDIVTKARQVDELAAEVAGASREQTQGITQINQAVSQMDKVTQSNAATAEETASAAEELNAQATTMKQSVAELLQLVGGRSETSAPRPVAQVVPGKPMLAKKVSGNQPAHNGNGHHNGHSAAKQPQLTPARGGAEIPMDDDFKNF